ncbi:hypothetical protein ANSO36C_63110 (plasmid) [Nostoc cf. commune SO-36]|uniref:Transposase n=1 Tax=Nostoc cf. commune SO-36 TaxID=449208 RepID=A0ABN6QFA8_NOSCO|nr:hypothetical protein ANSO36C_63110 [Nostoc cf. commune SO-36]
MSYEKIIDYYKLRFQIEFNFRDAKQFWGLEDFMNLSQAAVTNTANLAFFMVNLSHHLLPSSAEAQRLNNIFPNSQIITLPHSSHACLVQNNVNLYQILLSANFIVA